ncbi:MAG: class I SAM-dependent methyltransferase [Anaerolineales bacterium]
MPDPASPTTLSTIQYLAAKKSIDDRALNPRVWSALSQALSPLTRPRVLEVGCGIGAMLERMIERNVLRAGEYLGIDREPEVIREAPSRVAEWARGRDYSVAIIGDGLQINGPDRTITAQFAQADIREPLAGLGNWDLLVAHAVLDLVDIPQTLQVLLPMLRPGGLFYFSHVFDGLTILEPELDPELDAQILVLYHRSMDERMVGGIPSGDSRSGRHLLRQLQDSGAVLLEAGGSDWVVFARQGSYPADEADFLGWILLFIESSLSGHPELDSSEFADWMRQRREQLRRGELIYIAHQLDFLGRPV